MATIKLGQIIALLGLILLVLSGFSRPRGRRAREAAGGSPWWRRGLDLAALGLIVAGLLIMWAQK